MFFDLNMAPLRYSDITSNDGPVDHISLVSLTNAIDEPIYEAYCFLKGQLRPSWLKKNLIYSQCDGSGTDYDKDTAIYKCISEAMERWAFYTYAGDEKKFGFKINPSTTGMSAFPGFFKRAARKNALYEAKERWALVQWSKGYLPILRVREIERSNLIVWRIECPFKGINVLILEQLIGDVKGDHFYAYGFAASNTEQGAFQKALVELDRNRRIILLKSGGHLDHLPAALESKEEQGMIFYAGKSGHAAFISKVNSSPKLIKVDKPHLVCDTQIPGPWDKYTTVWRCLFENTDEFGDGLFLF